VSQAGGRTIRLVQFRGNYNARRRAARLEVDPRSSMFALDSPWGALPCGQVPRRAPPQWSGDI